MLHNYTTHSFFSSASKVFKLVIFASAIFGGFFVFSNIALASKQFQIDTAGTLNTNLISYWKTDESSSGTSAVTRNDFYGTNHLTDNNTTASSTGKVSNGADFESSNTEYISISDSSQSGLDITGSISVSFWVKFESIPSNAVMISKWLSTGNQRAYFVDYLSSTSKLRFAISPDGTGANADFFEWTWSPSTATWYHIVVTWNSSTKEAKFFVSNTQIGTTLTGVNSSIYNSTSGFFIGIDPTIAAAFDGIIDEVGLWSKALSLTEISNLYNSGNGQTMVEASNSWTYEL